MKKNSLVAKIYLAVILIVTYVPILLTVFYSFNESKLTVEFTGFSLKWYRELLRDRDLMEALRNSLVLAVLCCLLSVIIGTLGAFGMQKVKCRANTFIEYISTIPIMIPEIILGMVFLAVFSFLGMHFGMTTLVLAHTTFCVPYIFMQVKARLYGMDKSLEEAARDLGANETEAFLKVTLPLSVPGIVSGIAMVFLPAMTNYVVLDMLYNSTYIMGSLIGSYFHAYDWNSGSMISIVLLAIIFLVTWATNGFSEEDTTRGAFL